MTEFREPLRLTLGIRIRLLRKYCGMHEKKMARLLNITTTLLTNYEQDEVLPDLEMLGKIAAVCNTNPGYFFDHVFPEEYAQNMNDWKYIEYLNNLPVEVGKYIKAMIKSAYDLAEAERAGKMALKASLKMKRKGYEL